MLFVYYFLQGHRKGFGWLQISTYKQTKPSKKTRKKSNWIIYVFSLECVKDSSQWSSVAQCRVVSESCGLAMPSSIKFWLKSTHFPTLSDMWCHYCCGFLDNLSYKTMTPCHEQSNQFSLLWVVKRSVVNGSFWSNCLNYCPLLWLPKYLSGLEYWTGYKEYYSKNEPSPYFTQIRLQVM